MYAIQPYAPSLLGLAMLLLGSTGVRAGETVSPPATQPALSSEIRYVFQAYALPEKSLVISTKGEATVTTAGEDGKVLTYAGTLSPAQVAELIELLKGWEKLDAEYPRKPDGPSYQVSYQNKTVNGGSETPPEFQKVRTWLAEVADKIVANPTN